MSELQFWQIVLVLSRNMVVFISSSGRWKRSGIMKEKPLTQSVITPEVRKILLTKSTCIWRGAASTVRLLQTNT